MQLWVSLLEGGYGIGGGGDNSGGGSGDGDGEGEGEGGRESEGRVEGGAEKGGDKETASVAVLITTVRGGLESLRARDRGGGDSGGEAGEAGEAWLDVLEAMLCRAPSPPPPAAGSEAERPKVKPPEGWGMGMCGAKPVIVISDQLSASQALVAAEMAVLSP